MAQGMLTGFGEAKQFGLDTMSLIFCTMKDTGNAKVIVYLLRVEGEKSE
jgi:hypothetical protein